MKRLPVIFAALLVTLALAVQSPAKAQSASPQQIQGLVASGQEQTALSQLHSALQAHPDSGVAWYLTAEAQDAAGNEAAANTALANAQHYSPGLPFANASDVAALQSHIAAGGSTPIAQHSGISPVFIGIIGLVVLFLAIRLFLRPRRFAQPNGYPSNYPGGYGPPGPGAGPYPYGPAQGGFGSGIGGSLLGGLAAGAGFAAGERVIDDVFGNRGNTFGGNPQQDPNFGNGGVPDRDDGLQGNPGWDDNSGGQDGNFDPGNNW